MLKIQLPTMGVKIQLPTKGVIKNQLPTWNVKILLPTRQKVKLLTVMFYKWILPSDFNTINMLWSLVDIKGSQVIISKYMYFFLRRS